MFVPRVTWPQGDPLGPEFRVNTYTTGFQSSPSVASDSSGNFVVAWAGYQQGAGSEIIAQRYGSSGAPLGPEFQINTYTPDNQFAPAVASNPSGNFVVVWHGFAQDGSSGGVFGQRYSSSGAPLGPEFRVNTYTTDNQVLPTVASDADGNFVVVWMSLGQDGANYGLFGQRYSSSGAALGPEFRVNTYTTSNQYQQAVASDPAGNFVVVWDSFSQDGSAGVFGQRYSSSGAPLGPEFRVNTYTTNAQAIPSVASDAAGNFVVVWTSYTQDGSLNGIFGQRFSGGGAPAGPEFRVNTYTAGNQFITAVASDPSGNFVVVWESDLQDGSNRGVFGQRYSSTGAPLGPEFRVNTYTTDRQSVPTVTSDAAGNFVVVWESYLQDGSDRGVFGQRYSQIVPVELMQFQVE
jgi:hypothetical protein